MTINPKITIGGGVLMMGAGAHQFYLGTKATEKKRKTVHNIAGVALVGGGFLIARYGWGEHKRISGEKKVLTPAEQVASDLKQQQSQPQQSKSSNASSNGQKKNNVSSDVNGGANKTPSASDKISGDVKIVSYDNRTSFPANGMSSFDKILEKGNGNLNKTLETRGVVTLSPNNINEIKNERAENKIGVKVVGRVDPKNFESSKIERNKITKQIEALKLEHDAVKKDKNLGWNSDRAKKLRNDISILSAKLFYI